MIARGIRACLREAERRGCVIEAVTNKTQGRAAASGNVPNGGLLCKQDDGPFGFIALDLVPKLQETQHAV